MTVARPVAAPPEARRRRFGRGEIAPGPMALLMNLPSLAVMALVLAYPIYYAGYLSVHKVGIAEIRRGVFPFYDWQNYARLFEDELFWLSLQNTAIFTFVTVSAEIVLAVAIALLINQSSLWTSRVTRWLILLPYAIPPIANGLIWNFMYNFQFGFLNRILFTAGIIGEPINWAGNPDTALYAVTVPYIWRTLPFAILLIHAALQGIPRELYEAAAVDGATAWHRFRHVTLPLLRPIIAVILILRTSFAFAVFEEILAITQGGPGDATWVAAWYSYKVSFAPPFNIGAGSASAYVLAMIVGALAILYVKLVYRRIA
ncbi:MAG: sugar ABC transporter permease [Alphaproteobacteria bacterium]|nr:sugar ABC transporter permease [Alphaproteobacteria bacterium]